MVLWTDLEVLQAITWIGAGIALTAFFVSIILLQAANGTSRLIRGIGTSQLAIMLGTFVTAFARQGETASDGLQSAWSLWIGTALIVSAPLILTVVLLSYGIQEHTEEDPYGRTDPRA